MERGAARSHDLWAEDPLDPAQLSRVRRRAMLESCKWDPQVGDTNTLASFPLVMRTSVWQRLAAQAEQLDAEALAAQDEISRRPDLLRELGLPKLLCRALAGDGPPTPAAARVIRFDFHFTTEGWRISEANCDVPGGFSEGAWLPTMMADHYPGLRPAGDPAEAWAQSMAAATGPSGVIALLSAPGFMEDHQVTSFLAARLRERGCRPHLAKPEQIQWRQGVACLETAWHRGPLDAIERFLPSRMAGPPPRA